MIEEMTEITQASAPKAESVSERLRTAKAYRLDHKSAAWSALVLGIVFLAGTIPEDPNKKIGYTCSIVATAVVAYSFRTASKYGKEVDELELLLRTEKDTE